jgi:hypothetical protein
MPADREEMEEEEMTSEGSNRTNDEGTTSRVLGWLIPAAVGIGLGVSLLMPTGDKGKQTDLPPAVLAQREAMVQAIKAAKPGDFVITRQGGILSIREIRKDTVYLIAPVTDPLSIDTLIPHVSRIVTYDDGEYKKVARCYIRRRPINPNDDLSIQEDPCK